MSFQITATCHCGTVEITGHAPEGYASVARCDCSFCKRRQAANIDVLSDTLKITKGADNLGLYTFGTHKARHCFCKTCGIYTHHQRFSNPAMSGVNIGCIADTHPPDHEPIPWRNGRSDPAGKLD